MRVEEVEELARILHESGRETWEHKLDRHSHFSLMSEVVNGPPPFVEWDDLAEDAREGRRVMARYLLAHPKVYFAYP